MNTAGGNSTQGNAGMLRRFITPTQLSQTLLGYVTTGTLTDALGLYAKKTDLAPYAKTADLAAYAKTTDLPAPLAFGLPLSQSGSAVSLPLASATQDGAMPKGAFSDLATAKADVAALKAKAATTSCGVLVQAVSLALGASTTITVPFGTAMPDTNYSFDLAMAGAGLNLGNLTKSNVTKATTGVSFTLTSAVLLNLTMTFAVNAVRNA